MRRGIQAICGDLPPGLAALLLVVLLALAGSARQHAEVWRSESALWAHAVRLSPQKPRVLNNYGVTLVMRAQFDEARQVFEAAHRAGHSPHLPPWDRVEGEQTSRANLKALDALMGTGR